MQIILLRFCHIGTKRSVLWPSKYVKIRFRPELCPNPAGEIMTLPRSPSRLGRGHPSSYPTPLGTDPQNSSDIYAYVGNFGVGYKKPRKRGRKMARQCRRKSVSASKRKDVQLQEGKGVKDRKSVEKVSMQPHLR